MGGGWCMGHQQMHPCPICKATPEVSAWLKGFKNADRYCQREKPHVATVDATRFGVCVFVPQWWAGREVEVRVVGG